MEILNININNLDDALAYIQVLKKENADLKDKVKKQDIRISNLTEMLVNAQKKIFGRSSEQVQYIDGSEQISLFNEAEKESAAGAPEPNEKTLVAAHERSKKRTKDEIFKGIEHIKQVCEITPAVCENCGGPLTEIGEEFVRSELNIIPAKVFIVDIYQKKYKCEHCSDDELTRIFKAPVPVPAVRKSMATAATIAYIMQQKYQLGLPLYRMEQYWDAEGVELKRNTLANWIIRGSLWFKPLWDRMLDILLKEDIIHADETELRVLKRNGQQVDSVSRMWVFCSGCRSEQKMSLYFYHATRSGKVVEQILGDYSGYLQTDGYSAYNAAVNATRIGCWSHARRLWVKCLPKGVSNADSKAVQAFEAVEKIFDAEKRFVDVPLEQIGEQRRETLKPLLDDYWNVLAGISPVGGSGIDKAVTYSINQKKYLENVLLDNRIELTNNLAERAVKPFVIGRKNWLFSDTDKGADASARCYSIIESAKLNGLNVFAYLSHLLTELPKLGGYPDIKQLDGLLPWSDDLPEFCKTSYCTEVQDAKEKIDP